MCAQHHKMYTITKIILFRPKKANSQEIIFLMDNVAKVIILVKIIKILLTSALFRIQKLFFPGTEKKQTLDTKKLQKLNSDISVNHLTTQSLYIVMTNVDILFFSFTCNMLCIHMINIKSQQSNHKQFSRFFIRSLSYFSLVWFKS